MSARSIRRALERQALKEARKAGLQSLGHPLTPPLPKTHASRAQFEANRANAQFSTGPKTPEGKAAVALNAVKTGLTGRTVLLPGDDLEAYNAAAGRIRRAYNPVGEQEEQLVQSLIDTEWRLNRIPELESAIYALAMRRLAPEFADVADENTRIALIRGEAYLQHSRQLSNLSIQESRLLRRRDKDIAALLELQRQRREAEAKTSAVPVHREIGFEFSTAVLDVAKQQPRSQAPLQACSTLVLDSPDIGSAASN